jgi:hypothetical protein
LGLVKVFLPYTAIIIRGRLNEKIVILLLPSLLLSSPVYAAAVGEDPEAVVINKPIDRSCFIRGEDGTLRYYLDGPMRDGELLEFCTQRQQWVVS